LTPEALLRVGLSPAAKARDLKGRLRCRGCEVLASAVRQHGLWLAARSILSRPR